MSFWKRAGLPDRVKSLREINCSKNSSIARLGFVKPIGNGLRKKQNLIDRRPSTVETGLAEERIELRFRKGE